MSFELINANTDQVIKTLTQGEVINLATLPTRNLNIRATTNPATVGSVVFEYTDQYWHTHIENQAPYALFKDNSGNYKNWTPAVGGYTMLATPTSGPNGTGDKGAPLSISFQVVNQPPAARVSAEAGTDGEVKYFPNPFIESFTLQLLGKGKQPVTIYDAYGRRVWQAQEAQSEQLIWLGNGLAPGMYLLQVGKGKAAKRYRLVKTR